MRSTTTYVGEELRSDLRITSWIVRPTPAHGSVGVGTFHRLCQGDRLAYNDYDWQPFLAKHARLVWYLPIGGGYMRFAPLPDRMLGPPTTSTVFMTSPALPL